MENILIDKYKSAIEAENTIYLFYKYIADNAKNRTVKKNFFQLCRESKLHKNLLKIILKESTDEDFEPLTDVCKEKGLCPENFSLLGVINVSKDTEASAINFYKQILKYEKDPLNKEIIRFILDQEKRHLRLLKQEKEFLRYKETFKPIKEVDFFNFLSKLWR